MMLKRLASLFFVVPFLVLALAGCVSEQRYDALQQKYDTMSQELSAEIAADQVTITRLQAS